MNQVLKIKKRWSQNSTKSIYIRYVQEVVPILYSKLVIKNGSLLPGHAVKMLNNDTS